MLSFLSAVTRAFSEEQFVWGNNTFGFVWNVSHPALVVFGFPIYIYALCIVTGMCLAILIAGRYFKKRGYDPYDITVYAIAIIPLGVLGARAYVYIFPWAGDSIPDWSTYFNFRSGGLGIYGGVIVGYVVAYVLSKCKKQDFRIIVDCILPGVLLAQSIGRWGNFANQEAFGNLITTDYSAMPNFFEGINGGKVHGFNFVAVWIDHTSSALGSGQPGWYQATFFYESFCTFVGFLICVLVLARSKRYKLGWIAAFYGIYYGIVRLVIEGMRSDSLYLYIGTLETDIRISQLVSVLTITFGLWTLSKIYRKQLHALYSKMFTSERQEVSVSRWILCALSGVSLAVAIVMFVLGGESRLLVGIALTLLSVYSALGVWSLWDRLQLYCSGCGKRSADINAAESDYDKHLTATICYSVAFAVLVGAGLFSLIRWGIMDGIPNGVVLFVVLGALAAAIALWKIVPAAKELTKSVPEHIVLSVNCDCGKTTEVKLNKFLLFVFPPKVYVDYGVENLHEWIDPEKAKPVTACADGVTTESGGQSGDGSAESQGDNASVDISGDSDMQNNADDKQRNKSN